MTISIPIAVIVIVVLLLPFLVALLVDMVVGVESFLGWPVTSPLVLLSFIVTAAVCWTGLAVWWWMR